MRPLASAVSTSPIARSASRAYCATASRCCAVSNEAWASSAPPVYSGATNFSPAPAEGFS